MGSRKSSTQRPLQIAFVVQGGAAWSGGVQYSLGILGALRALPAEERAGFRALALVCQKLDCEEIEHIASVTDYVVVRDDIATPPLASRVKWSLTSRLGLGNSQVADAVRPIRPDFVYPYFPRPLEPKAFPSAAWIPDFQHAHHPELFSHSEIRARDRAFSGIATRARHVVLSSRDALADFARLYPRHRGAPTVLPFHSFIPESTWSNTPDAAAREYDLPDRYFVICNQFWAHKDHRTAFEALRRIRTKGLDATIVCTGATVDHRHPDYFESLKREIDAAGLTPHVRFLGRISRRDQLQIIRRSIAVIQPSLFEGWSTVVEDARALGKSILLSDLGVHREQAPRHATYFRPGDADALAAAMESGWSDLPSGPDLQREAVARAERVEMIRSAGREFLALARRAQSDRQ